MDPFVGAIERAESLRDIYEQPDERALRKDTGRIDELSRRLIDASPMVLLSSADRQGCCDVSPRGGPPGFVKVLGDRHLLLPDATGNRRLDSLANIVETGEAGLLFLIPGRSTTLRVNGAARVTSTPAVLELAGSVGRPPRTVVVIEIREAYAHCPKAFVRSRLWEPDSWPDPATLPTSAQVTLAHLADPALTVADIEERERRSLSERLA